MFVIVPNSLHDEINAKLDIAIAKVPDAEKDREVLYQQLLEYFDEHGVVPDFELQRRQHVSDNRESPSPA